MKRNLALPLLAALAVRVFVVDEGDLPIVVTAPNVREGLLRAKVPTEEVETLERLATARLRRIARGEMQDLKTEIGLRRLRDLLR